MSPNLQPSYPEPPDRPRTLDSEHGLLLAVCLLVILGVAAIFLISG
jgi:hypothetical protein